MLERHPGEDVCHACLAREINVSYESVQKAWCDPLQVIVGCWHPRRFAGPAPGRSNGLDGLGVLAGQILWPVTWETDSRRCLGVNSGNTSSEVFVRMRSSTPMIPGMLCVTCAVATRPPSSEARNA